MSRQDNVKAVFNSIFQEGPIHVLVNNAGISHVGNLEGTSEHDFDNIFCVNVKGMYNCMYALIAHMKDHGGGIILNMASIAGTSGLADRFAYSMSKGAVVAMTYSVAKDYLARDTAAIAFRPPESIPPSSIISCTVIIRAKSRRCLRSWKNRNLSGEWLTPRRSLPLPFFLCSDEASFITGSDYPIDGGFLNLRG